ncbi:MAG: phosphoglycerate kinase [Calditrichae bacterium]|nr:phosphoglycerate kinase [Calditrichia bacterium]
MAKLTIETINCKDKKVLVRCDFNVPLDEKQQITDDRRIQASLPTIKKIIGDGGSAVLCSHLGRPKGEVKDEMRLTPVAERLSQLLKIKVKMAPDCVGPVVQDMKKNLKPGEVILLENLRFHNEETKNETGFAKQLAEGCDLFVNDAFGTAHRAHASTHGVTQYFSESAAGFLIGKELKFLGDAIETPKRPMVAVLGGAKISGKIDVIQNLLSKVDTLIIGGGMAYTFYKAMGYEIGDSLLEEDKISVAKEIMEAAKTSKAKLVLPEDVLAADKFDNDAHTEIFPIDQIRSDMQGLDIGPKTIDTFSNIITDAKTIIWNGPMGVFEMPNFAHGTYLVAQAMVEATENGAVSIVGGGDSAAAISKFGLDEKFSHVSTGGGASLEYLEGKELPGIAALTDI